MRYCSNCGNPLNAGAAFCHNCGTELKTLVPEAEETSAIIPETEIPVEAPTPVMEVVPTVSAAYNEKDVQEEKEFLEQTHRLLRWERKAWSISGKIALIMGIVFAAFFFLIGVVGAIAGEDAGFAVFILMFWYAIIVGGMLIAVGIVSLINANKIPQYTDTMFKDFRAAHKRCNSIGMIVLCYFFNDVSLVFFLINFVRMKSNKELTKRILNRQGFSE